MVAVVINSELPKRSRSNEDEAPLRFGPILAVFVQPQVNQFADKVFLILQTAQAVLYCLNVHKACFFSKYMAKRTHVCLY